ECLAGQEEARRAPVDQIARGRNVESRLREFLAIGGSLEHRDPKTTAAMADDCAHGSGERRQRPAGLARHQKRAIRIWKPRMETGSVEGLPGLGIGWVSGAEQAGSGGLSGPARSSRHKIFVGSLGNDIRGIEKSAMTSLIEILLKGGRRDDGRGRLEEA